MSESLARVSTHHFVLQQATDPSDPHIQSFRGGGFLSNMLADDLGKQVHVSALFVKCTGSDGKDARPILAKMLSECALDHRDSAGDRFLIFVNQVIESLLYLGASFFELYREVDNSDGVVRLGLLPFWSLRRRMGNIYQLTTQSTVERWRRLPGGTVLTLRGPGDLGNQLKATATVLREIDGHRAGSEELMAARAYDFRVHQDWLDVRAAKAARWIGWDGRGSFMDKATDSLKLHRQLRFHLTWVRLVRSIAADLNAITTNSSWMGESTFEIELDGVWTEAELEVGLQAIKAGSESLDTLLRRYLLGQSRVGRRH